MANLLWNLSGFYEHVTLPQAGGKGDVPGDEGLFGLGTDSSLEAQNDNPRRNDLWAERRMSLLRGGFFRQN